MNRFVLVTFLTSLGLVGVLQAAPGEVDLTFDPGSGVDGAVNGVAAQADGKVIIGGGFRSVRGAARNGIARLNADGTADTTFNPGTGASDPVLCVVVQPNGKVLIGGYFTNLNGISRNGIARLNLDGSLDTTFNPGAGAQALDGGASVQSIALQLDGKVLVGGYFHTVGGTSRNGIARLNADGSLDATFNPGAGANQAVASVAVHSDGKVVVGGFFTSINGTSRNCIARLNANGSLDDTFDTGSGADNGVYSVAIQTDGRVVLGGDFSSVNGTSWNFIARLNADGSLDTTFDPGIPPDSSVFSVVLQTDGKVLVGGQFNTINASGRNFIARLNADGGLDSTFNPGAGASSEIYSLAVQTNGKVLIGGEFKTFDGMGRDRIARLDANGSLDGAFKASTGANVLIASIAVQTDGKVLVGGGFSAINGTNKNGIARLNANGGLDTTFDPGTGANGSVSSVALQTDGKVLVGGYFSTINGSSRNSIARLNANGSLDTTFNPGTGAQEPEGSQGISSIAVQADGKMLVGGYFTTFNGTSRNSIARLNANGSLDTTFNPGTGADGDVFAIAVQANGKVLMGGAFTTASGTSRNSIARLNANGSLDTTFDPGLGADNYVNSVAVQSDGKVLVGGGFTAINGADRSCVARLNADGSLDTTFDPGTVAGTGEDFGGSVQSVAVQPDGKVLIGGEFTTVNGTSRNRIARLNANGSLDSTFNPGTGASSEVFSVAVQADGKVLLAGVFGSFNEVPRAFVGRLLGGSSAILPFPLAIQKAGNGVVLTWSNTAFVLQSAPFVTSIYTNVPGATSPHTHLITGPQRYFRLRAN